MAKLKRFVLSAVQHFIDSGHYPFWECAVGMRRKPGFVYVARWGVHRFLTQNITLLVVMHYFSKSRIGLRLISVDAQDTTQSPILLNLDLITLYLIQSANLFISTTFSNMLPYQLLTTCLSKQRLPTKATNNPIGSPSSRTPPSGNSKPTTSRSSKRSPSATKTYNTPPGPSSKPYKLTTTILNNLQIRPFTHTITYKKPDESSVMPNQTFKHAVSETFGENFSSILENPPKHLQTNPPYFPPPHSQLQLLLLQHPPYQQPNPTINPPPP